MSSFLYILASKEPDFLVNFFEVILSNNSSARFLDFFPPTRFQSLYLIIFRIFFLFLQQLKIDL